MMNKKGFITEDTLYSPGFWMLLIGSWIAVILGWKFSQSMDTGGWPWWQLVMILLVCVLASAWFARE